MSYKRSFVLYAVSKDKTETFIKLIHNPKEGKGLEPDLIKQGFEYIRCRDCLGGLRFEYNLHTGRKTA